MLDSKYVNKKSLIIALAAFTFTIVIICFVSLWGKGSRYDEAVQELETMSNAIRSSYSNSPGYWGLDTKYVTDNNLVSNIKNGSIINVLGKDVFVGYGFEATPLMPGSRTFDIVYKNLNRDECIRLASHNFNEELSASIVSIILRSGDKTEEFGWGEENRLPISVNMAKRFCKDKNDILWRFE